jgi:hypothetical protein
MPILNPLIGASEVDLAGEEVKFDASFALSHDPQESIVRRPGVRIIQQGSIEYISAP